MYDNYLSVVRRNLDLSIRDLDFKSIVEYQQILEHVSADQGYKYIKQIIEEFGDIYTNNLEYIVSICRENDSVGKPGKSFFIDPIDNMLGMFSPTNFRYLYHALLILSRLKTLNYERNNIVEIGGGYGGLCLFIYRLCKFFDITIDSYSIFDIKDVCTLQKRYLEHFRIPVNTCDLYDNFSIENNSFLISNYAFSEIPGNIQQDYITRVIDPFISHGFLVWNFIPLYNFTNKEIFSEQERPLTFSGNLFVSF